MSIFHGRARLLLALISGLLAAAGLTTCGPLGEASEQNRVTLAFKSWQDAMISQRTDQAMVYIPGHVDDYLHTLSASLDAKPAAPALNPASTGSPGVDLFLRTALEKKVPPDLRSKLTLESLVQRLSNRHLLDPRNVRAIDLGHVSVDGDHASAEVYYQGSLTAFCLPFVKEGDVWKIDVMAILPYAEVLMRVDRAIKDETESQQVEQLVSKLPSL